MNASRIELLQRMPIFGALRGDTLSFLLSLTREVRLRRGEWFFHEGDPATGLFVLEEGQASVFKGWQGRLMLLRCMHPGDCFGEMSLMDFMPRSASVRADEDCRALELDSDHLYRLCKHDLEQFALMQMNMGREVSRRLRDADEQLFAARMGAALERPSAATPP